MSTLVHTFMLTKSTDSFKLIHDVIRFIHWRKLALFIYLLTPRSILLLEKLIGSRLVKKFPTFFGTRRSITVFTNARHQSLFWASSIQSIFPHPTSWRSILILSSHLRIGLPLRFPHQKPECISTLPHTCYMPRISNSSRFDHPNDTGWGVQIIKLRIM